MHCFACFALPLHVLYSYLRRDSLLDPSVRGLFLGGCVAYKMMVYKEDYKYSKFRDLVACYFVCSVGDASLMGK